MRDESRTHSVCVPNSRGEARIRDGVRPTLLRRGFPRQALLNYAAAKVGIDEPTFRASYGSVELLIGDPFPVLGTPKDWICRLARPSCCRPSTTSVAACERALLI